MRDILVRLRTDAGQLTIAELIQEREAAACEIERLLSKQDRAGPTTNLPRSTRETPAPAAKVALRGHEPLQLGELVRLSDVCKLVSLSRSSIYKRVHEASFPTPLKLSDHCVRWRREDLERWIRNPKSTA
jgi:predicted DNA-binding transcriptional regulator AlpA